MKKMLRSVIEDAASLGLPETHIEESKELLDYNEYGLSLDTIITQLYEHQIKISKEFYEKVVNAAHQMKISADDFKFLQELIA